jgi:hypothetical protein
MRIIIAFIFLLITSFAKQETDDLYLNYVAAIENVSTFQYFLVVKVKNLKTGKTREYCTKGNFLQGAVDRENNPKYNYKSILKNKNRYFEFKNDSAIWNISGWPYTISELARLENKIDFDILAKQIRKNKKWSMQISDDKTMIMYAHALFNRGILTGESDCFGGTLEYIDRNESENKTPRIEIKNIKAVTY